MPDGTIEKYDYYRLSEHWRDADGKIRKRTVVNLGELTGYTKAGRKELGALLEEMIPRGSSRMSDDAGIYDDAVKFYAHWRDLHPKASSGVQPGSKLEQALDSRRRDIVTICLSKVTNHAPRVIGPEVICRSTANRLGLMEFLLSNGFDRQEAELAVMQIIARAIYPYSEYRTVKYLRDNTALAEMFHIPKERLTKDALYKSALRLWDVHRRMEDWLHERVTSMFHLEEKILLLDITNTYMEGRMADSGLCFFGRSKEKRSDCKLVVLAAVVNTEGLIVRTMIYEGRSTPGRLPEQEPPGRDHAAGGGGHTVSHHVAGRTQDCRHGCGLLLFGERQVAYRQQFRLYHRAALRLRQVHCRQRQGRAP